MASCQCVPFSLLLSLLLLLAFPSVQEADSPGDDPPAQPDNVVMTVYYEVLCPDVINFIVGPLAEAGQSDLVTIIDLKLVPWGKSILLPDNTVLCQFGDQECYLNAIQACAIDTWPDVDTHFSFIACIEAQIPLAPPEDVWKNCADQLNLKQEPIHDCYASGHGYDLMLNNGILTMSLSPPLAFVPWVTVNDVNLGNDYMNFVDYVCNQSKATSKPKACTSLTKNYSGRAKSSGQSAMHGKHMVHGLTG